MGRDKAGQVDSETGMPEPAQRAVAAQWSWWKGQTPGEAGLKLKPTECDKF